MNILREAITDSSTGKISVKRLCMLIACTAMALCAVVLAVGVPVSEGTAAALGAVCVPLAGMCGYGYTNAKKNELLVKSGTQNPPEGV